MAENYPAMMSSIFSSGVAKPIDFLVRNPRVVRMVERWVLKRIDRILVVVEESRERLVALGVDPEKIALVSNTPPLARVTQTSRAVSANGALHLVYLGLLEAPRGLGLVLDALAICSEHGIAVRLTIVGAGRERAQLEQKAAELGLLGRGVTFLGFLPNEEALAVVAEADVGLVPHHATESWNSTIPNKLFDYMAAGLPVLSSNARPCARVVRESGAGLVYEHDNATELFEAIRVISDPHRRREMASNGPLAIREKFSWEHDTVRLLEAIDRSRPDRVGPKI
jgi:glycosyltransferase involved in cell wall biosynthesis